MDVDVNFIEGTIENFCLDSYIFTRTWIATDNCGNSTSHVQTLTVIDTTDPVFTTSLPTDVTVSCEDLPGIPTMEASDNCDHDVTITLSEIVSDSTCAHTNTITRLWVASDNCGNTTSHEQVIVISDNTMLRW